ncbi:hypothetical protein F5Y06DRAFT_270158 [Hypoxylon sp. FL0890]|nr:hypothetical protein F5Y06DRAFT_270158 [Hypoxylon sp. FL0890]
MELNNSAEQLISDLVKSYHDYYGSGTMTSAIYDTAWLSIVAKPINDSRVWLFPSSFEFLLRKQMPTGGWRSGDAETDEALDTAAALYALCRHRGKTPSDDLENRIKSASQFLSKRLQSLSFTGPLPVGFELLLPALLDLLRKEGVCIEFEAGEELLKITRQKLARIDIESLYIGKRSTILHSLEAFIGKVDFDRLGQHKVFGSMMASPSSTAAYLMNVSTWDDEAEEYLRHVVAMSAGKSNGGVPSAFPSTFFEFSWVVSTLLDNGFNIADLGVENVEAIKEVLKSAFRLGSGLVGFAPSLEPDADDTAKSITLLNMLDVPTSATPLIEKYCTGNYFGTYAGERDASISTNSNALIAMCMSPDAKHHKSIIILVAKFLCKKWWRDPNRILDKWNLSPYYTIMLITRAFRGVLGLWAAEEPMELPIHLLQEMTVVMFQALLRMLRAQREDGSWDGKRESTAYAIIAINSIAFLPIIKPILGKIHEALRNGRAFILRNEVSNNEPEYLWIEKVTYGSCNLSKAYCLAAARCTIQDAPGRVEDLIPEPLYQILKPFRFFRQLPIFSSQPEWCISASLIEGSLFKGQLRDRCLQVFPNRTESKEKHLSFIPFTWTAGNLIHHGALGSDALLELMTISALAYQVDEFIESEIAALPTGSFFMLKSMISTLVNEVQMEEQASRAAKKELVLAVRCLEVDKITTCPPEYLDDRNRQDRANLTPIGQEIRKLENIIETLKRFIRYIWQKPYVRSTTEYNRIQLKCAIRDFLIAHFTQTEDSHRLAEQEVSGKGVNKIFASPRCSLFNWTRTTSGDHTAGPFAILAFFCMLGDGAQVLNSPEAKYIAQDMLRHLAAFCRLYNDFGSVARDRTENNLNSINFPEFSSECDEQKVKSKLLYIAEYERRCLNASMAELRPFINEAVFRSLNVFCTSADMYGQMYVLKDLTPVVKQHGPVSGNSSHPEN